MDTLLIIDGNAIMHRAFHALPPFKTKNGVSTNVIYGFFSMLNKVITDFKPNKIIICFDTPKPTFRNKLFKEYQSQRPKIADDFITQIPLLKDAISKAGIFQIEKDGYEADDLIGTIANRFKKQNLKILILTGDKDILQVVDKNVFVVAPQLGLSNFKLYDIEEVKKKFNLLPDKIPDLKALTGDPSDNYPGAKGIGPKTASLLLNQFGTIANIYQHLKEINGKTKDLLQTNKENVLISHKLATIDNHVGLTIDIDKINFEKFNNDLRSFFEQYEMRSLVKRIFDSQPKKTKSTAKKPSKQKEDQMGLF